MLNIISILLTSVMLMGCVVSPDGWNASPGVGVDTSVDVGIDFNPRVHVGSRAGLSVWLHPNFVAADAYTIAQQHCQSFGSFARPARDWDIHVNRVRYLDYTCVSYRPQLGFPHIIVNHDRWFNRPWHRSWYNRRFGTTYRRGYNPRPRRNGWWTRNRGRRGRVGRPSVTRPRKNRYRNTPSRPGRGTYTPKPRNPKRNGWWGSRVNTRNNNSWYSNKGVGSRGNRSRGGRNNTYTPKPIKKTPITKRSKWSYKKPFSSKTFGNKKTVTRDRFSFKKSKKTVNKDRFSKPLKKVFKTEKKKVVKTVTKPRKSFFKTKVNNLDKKRVSKKNRYRSL